MAKRHLVSQHFTHPDFGEVSLIVKSNATNISARWSSAVLKVTIPPGVSADELLGALGKMKPRILARRPATNHYAPGWKYTTPEAEFEIVRSPDVQNPVYEFFSDIKRGVLALPVDITEPETHQIDRFFERCLVDYADKHSYMLLGLANKIAQELEVNPRSIKISRGEKLLGRCTSKGDIFLSRNLMFYPLDGRRYVIAHEFAHLTHLDHSPAFHALLNRYLDGQEARLHNRLKKHRLPFL